MAWLTLSSQMPRVRHCHSRWAWRGHRTARDRFPSPEPAHIKAPERWANQPGLHLPSTPRTPLSLGSSASGVHLGAWAQGCPAWSGSPGRLCWGRREQGDPPSPHTHTHPTAVLSRDGGRARCQAGPTLPADLEEVRAATWVRTAPGHGGLSPASPPGAKAKPDHRTQKGSVRHPSTSAPAGRRAGLEGGRGRPGWNQAPPGNDPRGQGVSRHRTLFYTPPCTPLGGSYFHASGCFPE